VLRIKARFHVAPPLCLTFGFAGFTRLADNPDFESTFHTLNPRVHVSPTQIAWTPFKLPPEGTKVDFVDGLKTVAGAGDPSMRDGLAIHMCQCALLDTSRLTNTTS
jgi:homogentisate 1,2-dioxygenase